MNFSGSSTVFPTFLSADFPQLSVDFSRPGRDLSLLDFLGFSATFPSYRWIFLSRRWRRVLRSRRRLFLAHQFLFLAFWRLSLTQCRFFLAGRPCGLFWLDDDFFGVGCDFCWLVSDFSWLFEPFHCLMRYRFLARLFIALLGIELFKLGSGSSLVVRWLYWFFVFRQLSVTFSGLSAVFPACLSRRPLSLTLCRLFSARKIPFLVSCRRQLFPPRRRCFPLCVPTLSKSNQKKKEVKRQKPETCYLKT